MSEEPNYKMIELQAENEHLKDDLIISLKARIDYLESEVRYLRELLTSKEPPERDVGSGMIVPSNFKSRPVIRTMTEACMLLEKRSLNSVNLPKSAEDVSEYTGLVNRNNYFISYKYRCILQS